MLRQRFPHFARAALRATTHSPSAPPSPFRCTTAPLRTRFLPSTMRILPPARSAPGNRLSTTFTYNSPARVSPTPPERKRNMTAISPEMTLPRPRARHNPLAPLATLAARRFQLSVRTPRELVVPLLTPILFALVIAPALKQALHTSAAYEAFVATGTIGLLIPLNTMFAGLGVIVDRDGGAQRGFLAWFAKFLPRSHGLALVRYGLLGDSSGLHNIWSMHSATTMATLSLAVVAFFAAALMVISIRAFNRAAVR